MRTNLTVEDIAKVCHEVNRQYCEYIGDDSQKKWENAPDWQKKSAKAGVELLLEYPTASLAFIHENWMRQKRDEGWTYGKVKDETKKTHPCLRSWLELPNEQKVKDCIFRAVVRAMAEM